MKPLKRIVLLSVTVGLLLLLSGCIVTEPLPGPVAEITLTGSVSGNEYTRGAYVPFSDRVLLVHGVVTDTDPMNSPDDWDGYVYIELTRLGDTAHYILSTDELTKVEGSENRWEFDREVRLHSGWNTLRIFVSAFPGDSLTEKSELITLTGDWSYGREPVLCYLEWNDADFADLNLHTIDQYNNDCSADDPNVGGMILDIGDNHGYGPEYITITNDQTGTYSVEVNYVNANGLTTALPCQVHVLVNGTELPQSPFTHTFDPDDVGDTWQAVEVNYNP